MQPFLKRLCAVLIDRPPAVGVTITNGAEPEVRLRRTEP